MKLPILPPFLPMEAKNVADIPTGPEWQYEPKWDGFRCLAFRDAGTVELQSKAGQSLTRYFPELVKALLNVKAQKFVLDGEIIVLVRDKLSFDDLLQRIHPAASRVARLANEHPARFVLFDQLVNDRGRSLVDQQFAQRRAALESFVAKYMAETPTFCYVNTQTDCGKSCKTKD